MLSRNEAPRRREARSEAIKGYQGRQPSSERLFNGKQWGLSKPEGEISMANPQTLTDAFDNQTQDGKRWQTQTQTGATEARGGY